MAQMERRPLQFEPFHSAISPAFWTALARKKLNELKLDQRPVPIWAHYLPGQSMNEGKAAKSPLPARLYLSEESFSEPSTHLCTGRIVVQGTLRLMSTIEAFKTFDKSGHLDDLRRRVEEGLRGEGRMVERECFHFEMVAFADLKSHKFYYHCLFPAYFFRDALITCEQNERCKDDLIISSTKSFMLSHPQTVLFSLQNVDGQWQAEEGLAGPLLVFIDPSAQPNAAGWPLRNYLLQKASGQWQVLLIRQALQDWRLLRVHIVESASARVDAVGWERNEKGLLAPRHVDLAPLMDPKQLAKEASELNLRLIKWRLLPDLSLETLSQCRVLLIGAGTLGCNGWGMRRITLVDNGRVSYSNPVRQTLFRFEDCLGGGNPKAETAAIRAMEIDPSAEIRGISMHVPMPGHRIDNAESCREMIERLWGLVKESDVVFLLTDSRESRWLPTVLGALEGKIVITIALGFDSFVVMRHGMSMTKGNPSGITDAEREGHGKRLGCYFCHDIDAPSDTLSNRTLDQQCTVTRPGLSYAASAMGVELLASLLQHPLKGAAPAICTSTPLERLPANSSLLGAVPHQIRGYLCHFQNMLLTGEAFAHCTACSPPLLKRVQEKGVDFLLQALEQPELVAKVTGADLFSQQPTDDSIYALDQKEDPNADNHVDSLLEPSTPIISSEDFCLVNI